MGLDLLKKLQEAGRHRGWSHHPGPTDGPQVHLRVVDSPQSQPRGLQPGLDDFQGTREDSTDCAPTPARWDTTGQDGAPILQTAEYRKGHRFT